MSRIYVGALVEPDRKRSGAMEFPDGIERVVTLRCSQWDALLEIIDADFVPLSTILQDSLSHAQEFPSPDGEEMAIREGLEMSIEVYLASKRAEEGAHANVNDPRLRESLAEVIPAESSANGPP